MGHILGLFLGGLAVSIDRRLFLVAEAFEKGGGHGPANFETFGPRA